MALNNDISVKSVERVFEILHWFDEAQEPASATEISRALDYPLSSTIALLKSMSICGYLQFDAFGHNYRPTLRVAFAGEWLHKAWSGPGSLPELVQAVRTATGEVVSVSCQNDLEMLYVQVEQGEHPMAIAPVAGDQAPLFQSSIGLTRLSRRPDKDVQKLVARYNRQTYVKSAKVDVNVVLQKLRRIRSTGYNADYDLYLQGAGAIAWALPARQGAHPLVLAVGGPTERLKRREGEIVALAGGVIRRYLAQPPAPMH